MKNTLETKELVLNAMLGNIEAFEEIVRRFQSMAYAYAFSRVRDFHLAEDVSQDAFVDAYTLIHQLRNPEAFPGWFRRIVHKHCDRLQRKKGEIIMPYDESVLRDEPDSIGDPERTTLRNEDRQTVREAIDALSPLQRDVVMLYYLRQYSQKEIAVFLEVPIAVVKKRLFDAKRKLKERLITMVSENVQENIPDERFSKKIINDLLKKPKPLEVPNHPIRRIWDAVQNALPDYEVIDGPEAVTNTMFDSIRGQMERMAGEQGAYKLEDGRILRSHMTHTMFQSIEGRTPPVCLLAAGRCFRSGDEDPWHSKIFHQIEGLYIDRDADSDKLLRICRLVIKATLGNAESRIRKINYGFVDEGIAIEVNFDSSWCEVGGAGLLKETMLKEAGYNPSEVDGFAFGFGVERMAMLNLRIDNINDLWKEPYLPRT